ncbi:hypothetical protein TNCV_432271 [Trichonephila clavipes]|nr:hypothetical protein TNCV_432271 [Trichonephila clavipes]
MGKRSGEKELKQQHINQHNAYVRALANRNRRGGPVSFKNVLSRMDFFFWDHMKCLVNETLFPSDEDLIARISVAAGRIRYMPVFFQKARNSIQRRCQSCQTTSGRDFEYL